MLNYFLILLKAIVNLIIKSVIRYKQTQRKHMINPYKKKQKRIKEMVKRFHFDPQSQTNINKSQVGSTAGKQKISQIIVKDQNGQYSSVKQKNDFNDSSWLAKLVNGIQQCDGLKHLSDVENLNSQGSQTTNYKVATEGQFYTITRKSSDNSQTHNMHLQKLGGRKSVPSITNFRNLRSRENKFSCHTINLQSQNKKQQKQQTPNNNKPKYQKWVSESSQNGNSSQYKKQSKGGIKNMEKNKKKRTQNKQEDCGDNHKNSLINYSSIKEQDRNQQNQRSPQKIIIDLDEISLHTQGSKQTTPIHARAVNISREQEKQQKYKSKQSEAEPEENKRRKNKSKSTGKQNKGKQSKKGKENTKISGSKSFIKIQQETSRIKIENIPIHVHSEKPSLVHDNNNKQMSMSQGNLKSNNSPKTHKQAEPIKNNPTEQPLLNDKLLEEDSNKIGNKELEIVSLQKDKYFSSYNEFLDTFKQSSLVQNIQQKQPIRVGGIIKKNRNKNNEAVSRIQVKQIGSYSQEARIPTFSERPLDEDIGISLPMSKELTVKQTSTKRSANFSPIKFGYQIKKQHIDKEEKDKSLSVSTIKKGESLNYNQKTQNNHNITSEYHLQFPSQGPEHQQYSQSYSQIKLQRFGYKNEETLQSPKFNYRVTQGKKQIDRPGNKILNYDEIFKKLDVNREHKLHKNNCQQTKLTEEQRYEIGPILSKIKYLDRLFTENQFALECMKVKNSQIKCQKNKNTYEKKLDNEKAQLSIYHTFQPHKKEQKVQNLNKLNSLVLNTQANFTLNTRSADRRKQYMKQNEHIIRGNIISSKNTDKVKRYRKYSQKRQQQKVPPHQEDRLLKNSSVYEPLFPETYHDDQAHYPPSRSPYLEMPSFPSENHQKIQIVEPLGIQEEAGEGKKQKNDIGAIIDNLNTKLSNYIQSNNLEDTYRKFKLQFVQLRRNMPY